MTTSISSKAQNFVDGNDRHGCFLQTTGNLILISKTEKILKIGSYTPKIWGKMKKFENSQNPAKRQSDHYCCFLQTTGNLILTSLTEKNLKIGLKTPKIWWKM